VLAFHWEELKLPWVAGEIIIPGTEAVFHSGPPDLLAGTINLELSGRCYRLRVPLIEQDSSNGRENY